MMRDRARSAPPATSARMARSLLGIEGAESLVRPAGDMRSVAAEGRLTTDYRS